MEDIFNKDPLELTRQDRDATVAYFRKARETFLKNEAAGKKQGKAAPKVDLDKTLGIDDLKLDLDL